MTEMDSQRDLVRASLDRDNQKDVTPIRRPNPMPVLAPPGFAVYENEKPEPPRAA